MSALRTLALGAALFAVAAPALAQLTATPSAAPLQRPFGSVPLVLPAEPPASTGESCDTACLSDLASQFMAALASRDGSKLPWANQVRYAENGVTMMIGDGMWANATAIVGKPLIVADARSRKAAWIGAIEEHGQANFVALEITAEGNRIASAELTARRKEGRPPFGDPVSFVHDPAFSARLPEGQYMQLPILGSLAHGFLDAQSERGAQPNFGKDCKLIENGVLMTGNLPAAKGESGDCATSFRRGLFKEFEAIRRRVVAFDETRGLVVVVGAREIPGAQIEYAATDGKTYKAEAHYPRNVGFMTVFKMESGAIARVESITTELPYLMPPAWPEINVGGRP
jgi:hypothetical protein